MKKTRNRATKNEVDKTVTMIFRLEESLKKEYVKYCDSQGLSYGKRLRILIQNDLKNA